MTDLKPVTHDALFDGTRCVHIIPECRELCLPEELDLIAAFTARHEARLDTEKAKWGETWDKPFLVFNREFGWPHGWLGQMPGFNDAIRTDAIGRMLSHYDADVAEDGWVAVRMTEKGLPMEPPLLETVTSVRMKAGLRYLGFGGGPADLPARYVFLLGPDRATVEAYWADYARRYPPPPPLLEGGYLPYV